MSLIWKVLLFATCLGGVTRWGLAEAAYSRGMAVRDPQSSIEALTEAGELWPYAYVFRTAQAKQLYELAKVAPGAVESAEIAMRYALDVDRQSVEILGALVALRRVRGDCIGYEMVAKRLLRLAPHHPRVHVLLAGECLTMP